MFDTIEMKQLLKGQLKSNTASITKYHLLFSMGSSSIVNRRRTVDTIAKQKQKGQKITYKTLHRKLKTEQIKTHLEPEWTLYDDSIWFWGLFLQCGIFVFQFFEWPFYLGHNSTGHFCRALWSSSTSSPLNTLVGFPRSNVRFFMDAAFDSFKYSKCVLHKHLLCTKNVNMKWTHFMFCHEWLPKQYFLGTRLVFSFICVHI